MLGVWIGIEVNTLRFIAFRVQRCSLKQVERCLKYFLIQSLGSGIWLLGSFIFYSNYARWFWLKRGLSVRFIILVLSLLLKLGVAPLFFWVPNVMRNLNWASCCILATWQKIIPLFMLIEFIWFSWTKIVLVFGIISALTGGIGGLNQINLRVLIAYSSIGHVGWIIRIIYLSSVRRIIYFSRYFIARLRVFFYLWFLDYLIYSQIIGWRIFGFGFNISLGIVLVSLGGIPPFTGFVGKWFGIARIITSGMYMIIIILLLGSLINLYYYLVIIRNLVVWRGIWRIKHRYEIEASIYNYVLLRFLLLRIIGLLIIFWV